MSVYITDIYFPGVGNVSNYNLQEIKYRFTVQWQETITYYPGFSETEGNGIGIH